LKKIKFVMKNNYEYCYYALLIQCFDNIAACK